MKKLLSICIPTHNSADALRSTIENIATADSFRNSELVEIVVSDNCSTDETRQLCEHYESLYPSKFLYHRNASNLENKNFAIAISKGSGEICKLHNCYYHFAPKAIDIIIKIILATSSDKPVIFLANGFKTSKTASLVKLASLDDFVDCVSYQMTWIGGFFIWKQDFKSVEDFSMYANRNLSQTEVLLRTLNSRKSSLVINEEITFSKRNWPRSGYNIAEVFGANYLNLLKIYVDTGSISAVNYSNAKKRVLIEHILPHYTSTYHGFSKHQILPYLAEYEHDDYFHKAIKSLADRGINIS